MPRTTLDLDASILRDLKRLQKQERKSLGKLVSELLAQALARAGRPAPGRSFAWNTQAMGQARVDLLDKDAVWRILDEEGPR